MANSIPFPLTMALTAILVVSQISPSWASRVLRVTAQDALEGRVALVVHAEGGGVILDFSPLGETIRKISLDDPSQIVYDSCLVIDTPTAPQSLKPWDSWFNESTCY
jgi:hypothetical protein